jgi:hypothetical protein
MGPNCPNGHPSSKHARFTYRGSRFCIVCTKLKAEARRHDAVLIAVSAPKATQTPETKTRRSADRTIFESWFGSIDWFPGGRGDRAINGQSNLTGRGSVANAGFADTTRAAHHVLDLHVLDKGTQFRQGLASARIVEEEPRRCDGKRRE